VLPSRQVATVDQRNARADGDVVAGDKTETVNNNYFPTTASSSSIVMRLVEKLKGEVEINAQIRHTVENLQYFHERRAHDGIEGLEAKLIKADRQHELFLAFEKKEQFTKLVEKWSLYASAQEIFAYMLAKAEHEFTMFVLPKIGELDQRAINQLVTDKIIVPTIDECGCSIFILNHSIVMGMVYWLAEQCFVRWHQ
jgi:hypothetical protein